MGVNGVLVEILGNVEEVTVDPIPIPSQEQLLCGGNPAEKQDKQSVAVFRADFRTDAGWWVPPEARPPLLEGSEKLWTALGRMEFLFPDNLYDPVW